MQAISSSESSGETISGKAWAGKEIVLTMLSLNPSLEF